MARRLIEEGKYKDLLDLEYLKDETYSLIKTNDTGYKTRYNKTVFMMYLENPCKDLNIHQKILERFIPIMNLETVDDSGNNIINYIKNEIISPGLLDQVINNNMFSYVHKYNTRKEVYIHLCRTEVLSLVNQQALNRERKLVERISKLEQFIDDHLKYSPDGDGAEEAKNDFNNQLNIKDKVDKI